MTGRARAGGGDSRSALERMLCSHTMRSFHPAAALATLALGACDPPPPPLPSVLYLRQQIPSGETMFPRVDPSMVDVGTVGPDPPGSPEDRSCGDVVAFGFEPGLDPQARFQVDEILVRVWWYGGAGRGAAALVLPGEERVLDQVAIAATDETMRPEWERYSLLLHRFEIGEELSGAQLNSLFFTLDASNAAVRMPTCPALRSLMLLNPPPGEELERLDSDGDGMRDGEELREGRDPRAVDPPAEPCLVPVGTVRPPEDLAAPTLPPRGGLLPDERIDDQRHIQGQVLHHYGDLDITGALVLEDSWLILEPDPISGRPPTVRVREGGSLRLLRGGLASPDPRWGFHVSTEKGSTLEIRDSAVLRGGFLKLLPSGHPGPTTAAIMIGGANAILEGNTFAHNLIAISDTGARTRIASNRFLRNGTALWAGGDEGLLQDNTSEGDGTFVRLDGAARDWTVQGNTVRWWTETALVAGESRGSHRITDNRLMDGNRPLSLRHDGAVHELRGNHFGSCWKVADLQERPFEHHRMEDNHWERSQSEACP